MIRAMELLLGGGFGRGPVPFVAVGTSLCALCGLQLAGDSGLCPHHSCMDGGDWAVANRIMCDFFHRGIVRPRLSEADREDDFWTVTAEAP